MSAPEARGRAKPISDPVNIWLVVMIAMIAVMVVLGGVTRLTESGLSMVDWRPIMGVVPPLNPAEWHDAFAAYRQFPEYLSLNYGMTLGEFKGIFWREYIHRLWGRTIGFAFLIPFLWFMVRGRLRGREAAMLGGVFVLGAAQGVMGWVMVMSGLADEPRVSPYRLTAHLALALAIYGWLLAILLRRTLRPADSGAQGALQGLRGPLHALIALVVATILTGGFVAGLDAGLSFNTFPLMDGRLVPPGLLELSPAWRNFFENVALVQFDHRLLALLTVAATAWLWLRARRLALPERARWAVHSIAAMALIQPALGIATLLMVVPVALGAAHQVGALTLLGLVVWAAVEAHPRRPAA